MTRSLVSLYVVSTIVFSFLPHPVASRASSIILLDPDSTIRSYTVSTSGVIALERTYTLPLYAESPISTTLPCSLSSTCPGFSESMRMVMVLPLRLVTDFFCMKASGRMESFTV